MNLRITNFCNNNCLYCLEQSYRVKEKFIDKYSLFYIIKNNKERDNITFYGGNPILHPELLDIISFCKKEGYKNIGILTNTYGIDKINLLNLEKLGLNYLGIYFNSFDFQKHSLLVNGGIEYKDLLFNIELISKSKIYKKVIIHVNGINIVNLYNDIFILNKKYGIFNFEFVNYFPFDRPYDLYRNYLEYDYDLYMKYIDKLFLVIKKLNLSVRFVKFDKAFFGSNLVFYNFDDGIVSQIGEEDNERLLKIPPDCFIENKCKYCFIKDNCIHFKKNKNYE